MSCDNEVAFAQQLADVDARSRSNTKRLDKLEELTTVVHELASTMKLMAEEQKRTNQTVDRLDNTMSKLKELPAKRWEGIVDKVLGTVIGLLVGYVMARLGLK